MFLQKNPCYFKNKTTAKSFQTKIRLYFQKITR